MQQKKLLTLAIVGPPNVGKSTLINKIIDKNICAVSDLPHTTKENILAIKNIHNTQLIFVDTPGIGLLKEQKTRKFISISRKTIYIFRYCYISF